MNKRTVVDQTEAEAKRAAEQVAIQTRLKAVTDIMALLEPLDERNRSIVMRTVAIFYGYSSDNY